MNNFSVMNTIQCPPMWAGVVLSYTSGSALHPVASRSIAYFIKMTKQHVGRLGQTW